ncbi:MAG TPA: oleate hydratase, partial [Polyangiaceae bacterium]
MIPSSKAYLIGGGIGSLAAAAFLIRDGKLPAENISIMEAQPLLGGSLDGAKTASEGYSMRGGRMLTTDNYECTWDLFRSIPSNVSAGKSVFEETVEFNERHAPHSMARLVDSRRAKVAVTSMGFDMQDRAELLKLTNADEESLGASCISDWFSPRFFETEFWYLWATTFAFQPWHSAVEFKRYVHRFMLEFSRLETLGGVKRTIYNQYDSLVLPLERWLDAQGVHFIRNCTVTDLDHREVDGKFLVTGIHCLRSGGKDLITV